MPEYLYDVALSTPLGIRRGTMKMHISGEQADGWLRLLGHQEPFYGTGVVTCMEKSSPL